MLRRWLRSVAGEYCLRFGGEPPRVYRACRRYLAASAILLAALAAVAALAALKALELPWMLLLALLAALASSGAATLVAAMAPYLKLRGHFDELEREGLWVASVARFYAAPNSPPLALFRALAKSPFEAARREAAAFLRLSAVEGELAALAKLLARVPRGAWYRLLRYVESVAVHGQDPEAAAEALYRTVESEYRARMERRASELQALAVGSASLFTLLPMTMLTMAAVMASSASAPLAIATTLVNGAAAVAVAALSSGVLGESRVMTRRYLRCAPLALVPIASLPALALGGLSVSESFALIVAATVASLALAALELKPQVRALDELMEHTPLLLSDALVYMHQGMDLVSALREALEAGSYPEDFRELMRALVSAASVSGFEEALSELEELVQRPVFASLALAAEASRAGSLAALSAVAEALRDYRDAVLALRRRLGAVRAVFSAATAISVALTGHILRFVAPALADVGARVSAAPAELRAALPMEFLGPEDLPGLEWLVCLTLFANVVVGALAVGAVSSLRLAGGVRFALLVSAPTGLALSLLLLGVV